MAVQEAGAHALLVEAISPEVHSIITGTLRIPVYGIGAGPHCDGQLLIVSDMLGIFEAFTPKFVKKYADVAGVVTEAMRQYVRDVKGKTFPADEHCYHMLEGESEKLKELIKEYD